MKLSISNIAWDAEMDDDVYRLMNQYGFCGLEIAPTRIFPEQPYLRLGDAARWSRDLKSRYGFIVSSMQSIWFGRSEKIFGDLGARRTLIDYTKKAIDFASIIGCKNLVFGCPRNRIIPDNADINIALEFFKELGDYAKEKGTALSMEPNPPIYNTNFINYTSEAIDLIKEVSSDGFLLNLDIGTMIYNEEKIEILSENIKYIRHIHISEPGLNEIKEREIHKELKRILSIENYDGFVSIEMKRQDKITNIEGTMKYVRKIFG